MLQEDIQLWQTLKIWILERNSLHLYLEQQICLKGLLTWDITGMYYLGTKSMENVTCTVAEEPATTCFMLLLTQVGCYF